MWTNDAQQDVYCGLELLASTKGYASYFQKAVHKSIYII